MGCGLRDVGGVGGTFSHPFAGSRSILAGIGSNGLVVALTAFGSLSPSSIDRLHFTRIVLRSSLGFTLTPSLATSSARSWNIASSRLRSRSTRSSSFRAEISWLERGTLRDLGDARDHVRVPGPRSSTCDRRLWDLHLRFVATKDQASSVECPETMTNPCYAQFELVE